MTTNNVVVRPALPHDRRVGFVAMLRDASLELAELP